MRGAGAGAGPGLARLRSQGAAGALCFRVRFGLAPGGAYEHNVRNHDTNAHAHLRAAVIGPSESIPVVGGELGLGTWQQVVLLDFDDRPRERVVSVQVLS